MARGRAELAGDLVAWLIRCVPAAVWQPKALPADLNPFRAPQPLSDAMRKHLENWEQRRWRAATGG